RHLRAHAALADACQVPEVHVAPNGTLLRLAPGPAMVIDEVFAGKLALDGKRLIPLGSGVIRERHNMMQNGAAVVTLALDRDGEMQADPQITTHGVFDKLADPAIADRLIEAVYDAIEDMPARARRSDDAIREAVRIGLRRCLRTLCGKRPKTEIHLVRV
ncbi:MAG: Ribonuclease J, partial [Alphaproteobacteria bacterium MarineAlpha10_Bin3]